MANDERKITTLRLRRVTITGSSLPEENERSLIPVVVENDPIRTIRVIGKCPFTEKNTRLIPVTQNPHTQEV